MRRQVPLTICFIMGIALIVQFFIPHPASKQFLREITKWFRIVVAFSLVLGTGSLIRLHIGKITRHRQDWQYSILAMACLVLMLIAGALPRALEEGSFFMNLFQYVQIPLQATMFSILAFYMASAAYRAFKARTIEATLLLVAAVVVMLGRVPLGQLLWSKLPEVVEWILAGPNMAAKRGIMIGVGLGMMSTALKIILGIERAYIGGGD